MARTPLSAPLELEPQTAVVAAGAQDLSFEASDSANGNEVTCTGDELVIVENTDASPQTVTLTTKTDEYGRAGSITAYSLAAGDIAIFGPFPLDAWRQTDDQLYIDTSDDLVHIALVRVPKTR